MQTKPLCFDGPDIDPTDVPRLATQLERVRAALSDGLWHTLDGLAREANCTTQSASARVRDLRKHRFGGHTIERQRVRGAPGVFVYRLQT